MGKFPWKRDGAKVWTTDMTLSFPYLLFPTSVGANGKPVKDEVDGKYSSSLVADVGESKQIVQEAIVEAAVAEWGDKAVTMLKAGEIVTPIRTDAEKKGYPAGSWFLNVRSTRKPGVVHPFDMDGDGKPDPMTDEEITKKMYAGARVKATIVAFTYVYMGKKGVSFGLNNLQWVGDGPRLDAGKAAKDDFDVDPAAVPAEVGF
jgi:Protein of unknown function (DUF2815)